MILLIFQYFSKFIYIFIQYFCKSAYIFMEYSIASVVVTNYFNHNGYKESSMYTKKKLTD